MNHILVFDYHLTIRGTDYDGYESDPGEKRDINATVKGHGIFEFPRDPLLPMDWREQIRKTLLDDYKFHNKCRLIDNSHVKLWNIHPFNSDFADDEDSYTFMNVRFKYPTTRIPVTPIVTPTSNPGFVPRGRGQFRPRGNRGDNRRGDNRRGGNRGGNRGSRPNHDVSANGWSAVP